MKNDYDLFGGNSLGLRSSRADGKVEKFMKYLNRAAEVTLTKIGKNSGVELTNILFESQDSDKNSVTPCSVATVVMRQGEHLAALCFLISQTNTVSLPERKIRLKEGDGVAPINSPRFISEVHDSHMLENLAPRIRNLVGASPDTVVHIVQSIVIYHTMEINEAFVFEQFTQAVTRLHTHLGQSVTGDVKDVTVDAISNSRGSRLVMTATMGEESRIDSAGIPLANSVRLKLNVVKNDKRNSDGRSERNNHGTLNRPRDEAYLGAVNARASVIYSGGVRRRSSHRNGQGQIHHAFTPQLVLENFDMGAEASFGKFMLMLTNFTVLHDKELMKKMFTDAPIGMLNLTCNVDDEEGAPAPIDPEDIRDYFSEYYEKFFTAVPIVSLMVRPGTWEFEYTQLFSRACSGDSNAIKVLRSRIAQFCCVDNSDIDMDGIIGGTMEEYPVGTYTMNNNKSSQGLDPRSGSEVDILWLMNKRPDDGEIHRDWVRSQKTQNIDEGYARKLRIIRSATDHRFDLLDHRFMVTFTPAMLALLKKTYRRMDIAKEDNLNSFDSLVENEWARHMYSSYSSNGPRGGWDDGDEYYRDDRYYRDERDRGGRHY